MTKTLEAHDKLLKEVFKGDFRFVIPEYQRPYAWTEAEAEELFTDLLSACRNRTNAGDASYFLGSIVLIKAERDPLAYVVDGQQRLTSLTMLFSALRATTPARKDVITEYLYKKADPDMPDEKDDYRLTVREEDADFFRENILVDGGIEKFVSTKEKLRDSRLRFRENANFFMKELAALDIEERTALRTYMDSQCSLVVITTPNLDSAYRIFSVLNDRGLDLAPVDILKAEALGSIRKKYGQDVTKTYAKKWGEIEGMLGRDAFGALLVHVRMIYAKQKQRGGFLPEFREAVSAKIDPKDLLDTILKPYAEVWAQVKTAQFSSVSDADEINDHLTWLNRIAFGDWVAPVLVFLLRFKNHPEKVLEFLKQMERLSFYLLILRKGVNERIETYARVILECQSLDPEISVANLKSCALDAKQQSNFAAALDGNIYETLPRARMIILLRLEAILSDGSKEIRFKNTSVEHVLPQNPDRNSEWLKNFTEKDERESWTHRLANLVPLHARKNPAASNFDFDAKKNVYFFKDDKVAPFILTNQLKDLQVWSKETLQIRQDKLVSVLKKHWDLAS